MVCFYLKWKSYLELNISNNILKIFFILTILISSSFAQCKGWVGRDVPKAYCWDIEYINSSNIGLEYTINKVKTTQNHSGFKDKNNGIIASINVYGYPQNKPKVLLNNIEGKLLSKEDVINRLGILNYTRYLFILPQNSIDVKGMLEVKDSNKLKRMIYIK